MELLAESFTKLYSRLEDDLHRHNYLRLHRDFSGFLRDFESDVSGKLSQLLLSSNTRSDFFSVPWIHQLLLVIPEINEAFAKLVVELEHPIREWKSDSVDEYLNYTMNLLELFNSMSSSLSHLSRERILISYALIRARTSPSSARAVLKPIQRKKLTQYLKKNENEVTEKQRKKNKPTKDSTIRQALRILRGVGLWICGITVAALHGDETTPYLESRKPGMEVKMDALDRLNSEIYRKGSEKKWVLNEVRELNEAVGRLISAIDDGVGESGEAEKEVGIKAGEFERQLEGIEKEVNRLFSEVLAGRTQIVSELAMAGEKEKHWD